MSLIKEILLKFLFVYHQKGTGLLLSVVSKEANCDHFAYIMLTIK
jgi:hypothetical protein